MLSGYASYWSYCSRLKQSLDGHISSIKTSRHGRLVELCISGRWRRHSVQNGSLMALMYSGRITQAQQMPIAISSLSRVNNALKNMGSGWMIHVDAIRKESASYSDKKSTPPDPISQAMKMSAEPSLKRKARFAKRIRAYDYVLPTEHERSSIYWNAFDDDKKDPHRKSELSVW